MRVKFRIIAKKLNHGWHIVSIIAGICWITPIVTAVAVFSSNKNVAEGKSAKLNTIDYDQAQQFMHSAKTKTALLKSKGVYIGSSHDGPSEKLESQLDDLLRVRSESNSSITEFSKHQANGCQQEEGAGSGG